MKAKPFVKWVGGKGQLLLQLDELLPSSFASNPQRDKKSPITNHQHRVTRASRLRLRQAVRKYMPVKIHNP